MISRRGFLAACTVPLLRGQAAKPAMFADAEAYERWRKIQKLLNRLRNEYDFLLIDDVGKEYRTSSNFAENEFDYLLRHRYDRGLPTLMTSNVPLDQWVETYGEAMHSFVHECVYLIDMNGLPDLRRSARA